MNECEKKGNKEKSGNKIDKCYVKNWNDLNERWRVAESKINKKKKKIRMECKSEEVGVRNKWISEKEKNKIKNIMKKKKNWIIG
jgi:hypothetical protein